ncbi:MAG: MarR family winged helix-turn-helix transcriptional regulator [Longimicrobiales bacterium]
MTTKRGRARAPRLVEKALVDLLGAADRVKAAMAAVVEPYGITAQQYNVLRILRGAGPEGLPTLAIAERMLERSPGITRMIDRLEAKGLVTRERRANDRRCVDCRITAAGSRLLAELDEPVDEADAAAFATLNRTELRQLTALLERVQPENST